MVHPEFEDAFDVYSTNQAAARTLIHPSCVERLIAIENALAASKLRAMFCDGTITVMLWLQNMFESGRLDARKDREKVEQTIRQFRSLADLAIDQNRRQASGADQPYLSNSLAQRRFSRVFQCSRW
jgi:hypothetical protein